MSKAKKDVCDILTGEHPIADCFGPPCRRHHPECDVLDDDCCGVCGARLRMAANGSEFCPSCDALSGNIDLTNDQWLDDPEFGHDHDWD